MKIRQAFFCFLTAFATLGMASQEDVRCGNLWAVDDAEFIVGPSIGGFWQEHSSQLKETGNCHVDAVRNYADCEFLWDGQVSVLAFGDIITRKSLRRGSSISSPATVFGERLQGVTWSSTIEEVLARIDAWEGLVAFSRSSRKGVTFIASHYCMAGPSGAEYSLEFEFDESDLLKSVSVAVPW